MSEKFVTIDGNEATAYIAHRTNEVCAIYPITPSSNMGEFADEWSSQGRKNMWGSIPSVMEMQSEAGAAAAVHGALQTGALTTTFTASQGLLLMIPTMYKIAGELTSTVFHVAARSIAAQALSIFGDHADINAVRSTGFALLSSASVQEAHDMALISQAATLASRIPFVHFFDGFRTSHEIQKISLIDDETIRAMMDDDLIRAHRERGLSPDSPVLRGTSQNPDVFFQARESVNSFYDACPGDVQAAMDKFASLTGRQYKLYEYEGHPEAERVIVVMGSGAYAVRAAVNKLIADGEKVGVLKVRLYRPFATKAFIEAFPKTTKSIAILDRTKEPGSSGEPLYLDAVNAIEEATAEGYSHFEKRPRITGGRFGLSSKEFTPAMAKAVYDELYKEHPKRHFTIGINDDVTHTSLPFDPSFKTEPADRYSAMFYGLGSDGTVGANKNTIKIIGETTDHSAQGYFVYDSKKAGAVTISHLRFGDTPINSPYLITDADFIGVHQTVFLERYELLEKAKKGSIFLLNTGASPENAFGTLSRRMQTQMIEKEIKFYVIDAYTVAKDAGMGVRINTIMQTCFFAISGVLPAIEAIEAIKTAIKKTYGKKGEIVVRKNFAAVDAAIGHLHQVEVPAEAPSDWDIDEAVSDKAPKFVREVLGPIMADHGDDLPVSAMPVDGTYPTGTTKWEKRNIGLTIPTWDEDLCIECGKCVFVCPHSAIRAKAYDPSVLELAPLTFKHRTAKTKEVRGQAYTIQIAPEDCTGCNLCAEACPAVDKANPLHKALDMVDQAPLRLPERENFDFFLDIAETNREILKHNVKGVQFLEPLFEFSGACLGCGETPYISLLTRLFGDHAVIANATGCSSIYGGNLPTTPWTKNADGRGPAWNNSLFEDGAEFGLGFRLTIDKQMEYATELLKHFAKVIGEETVEAIRNADQSNDKGIREQRERIELALEKLEGDDSPKAKDFRSVSAQLVKRSVWSIGGDGWAYDIGYGGVDHVLASGKNINILVLDTGVYSNTGGQMSKATPLGAMAKFAAAGKTTPRKDLGMLAMGYGNVYVAQIAMGSKDAQTLKAFKEAEAFDGPSIIIAYSQCIAHGIDMTKGMEHQDVIVKTGAWPLYRFDPRRKETGKNPLILDSKAPSIPLKTFAMMETRFASLFKSDPERADELLKLAQADVNYRWKVYEQMAGMDFSEAEAE